MAMHAKGKMKKKGMARGGMKMKKKGMHEVEQRCLWLKTQRQVR